MTQRRTCSSCGYDALFQFLDLGLSPIADAYTATRDEVSKTYPLQLAVCTGCRLVQLLEVVDGATLFGTGYSFYSSASAPLSRYHDEYASYVLTTCFELAHRNLVVEVGCNDGDMLRHFREAGCRVVGVDPATGPVDVARQRGLTVWEQEFTAKTASELLDEYGEAGVVIANHVLAHVENVADVLRGVANLLADDGVAFVEVQYLPDLLVNNAFDLVYHEHRQFFSLTSLEAAAKMQGLRVVDARLTSRQGGSLRVMLRRQGQRATSASVQQVRNSEWWLNAGLSAYDGVQGRVERIRTRLWDALAPWTDDPNTDGYVLAGYGAPAKATTLLNFCEIDANVLRYVVDSTAAKVGRYIPGTGIKIRPEADEFINGHADAYLLLAWNYAHEIISRFPAADVRWIVPIPAPVVI